VERCRGRRRGAPASVKGPLNALHAGPTAVGRGGRRVRAFTSPSSPPESRVSPPFLFPIPLVCPAFLLGRGRHDIFAVDGSSADGGNDVPKCGARRAPGVDGGLECWAPRAGVEWEAGPVGSPPRGGGRPSRRRGADDGRGQVGRPGAGDRSDQQSARQYGRRQRQRLKGGHPTGWQGSRIGASHADGRHQVKWRGLGDGPREGGPSVAPG